MNQDNPIVSIIIPSYNHEKYVKKTIKSIWEQSYKNIELIVLDDGSKDNTPDVLLELKDKSPINMEVIIKKNEGATKTINQGIKVATGKYFIYLSSDDYLDVDRIDRHVKFLEKNDDKNIAGCYGSYTIVDKEGEILSFNKKRCMGNENQFFNSLKRKYQATLSASTLKMSVVKEIMFDSDIFLGDWDFFLRLSQNYKMLYVPGNTYFYRQVESGMNRDLEKMFFAREQIFNKYKSNKIVKNDYGTDRFEAEIAMANAISFFHVGEFESAKPFIWKALNLDVKTTLNYLNFIIKIYLGEKVVNSLRKIKHKILKK